MPQEIKGTSSSDIQTGDKNQAVIGPSPADNDKIQAMPRPDLSKQLAQDNIKAFGVRKQAKPEKGRSIFEKSE
jgi:hypothetical protein